MDKRDRHDMRHGPARAAEIAGKMVDAVIHDNDLLDLGKDAVATAKADLAAALADPHARE